MDETKAQPPAEPDLVAPRAGGLPVPRGMWNAVALEQGWTWVALLFAIALVIQLAVLGATFPGNEAVNYYDDAKIALNLLDGNGYSISYPYRNWLFYEAVLDTAKLQDPIMQGNRISAVKQPGYPLLLTAMFYCFGKKNFLAVFLLHSLLSSLTVALVFLSLRKSAPFAALAAGFGMAVYPPFFIHSVTSPESTTPVLCILAGFWFCLVRMRESQRLGLWAAAGALAGLAVLTEPVTLPFVGLAFAYAAWFHQRRFRERFAALLVAGLAMSLLISPWLARNYFVFHRFPVFKSGLGLVFNWGLHFSKPGSWIPEQRMVELEKAGRNLSELQEDEAIRHELKARFPSHWRQYAFQVLPEHFLQFWWDVPRYWHNYSLRYLIGRRVPYLLLLCVALPGLWRFTLAIVRSRLSILEQMPLQTAAALLMVTCTIMYTAFGAFHSRYRLPAELSLFIFAAGTLAPVFEALWNRARTWAVASSVQVTV